MNRRLGEKLKHARKKFSLNYEQVDKLSIGSCDHIYFSQICKEYNVLVVGNDKSLLFFDLETRKQVFECRFATTIRYFTINRYDLFLSCQDYKLRRYNLEKIMNKEQLSDCLIWESPKLKNIWGFAIQNQLIYVCDFSINGEHLKCFDYSTGALIDLKNTPKLTKITHITFSQYNEMFVCGYNFLAKLVLKDDNQWVLKKKVTNFKSSRGLYSIYYEKASERIFVTDHSFEIIVFDRNLNQIHTFKNRHSNDKAFAYGINIDEETGYSYLSRYSDLIVYK